MPDAPTERRPRTPLPRGPAGSRAAGSGDGRGGTPDRPRGMGRMPGSRQFWIVVVVLLAINYLSVAVFAPGREKSVRVPYSPTFLTQVRDGNVARISSTGETVEGEFKRDVRYPNGKAEPAKNFDT
jgi:cell division protease FtsH